MKRITKTPYHSQRIGPLPKGCRLCVKGAKLVLLTTGVCGCSCWYCPLSDAKKNRDVVVANEWWVKNDSDILKEAALTGAQGAGITGGDPLSRLERTLRHIRLLKRKFGKEFHIHLYAPTKGVTQKKLAALYKSGLDEIRFHPWFLGGNADVQAIREAVKFDWDVGCEIPVIPGHYRETVKLIQEIDELGVKFLNLNQFEVSETNAKALQNRGYEAESDESFAVRESGMMGLKLLDFCAKNTQLNVHYCTVKLKDAVQLRNRLKRRAKNVAKDYDIITKEGLLIRGAIYLKESTPSFGYKSALQGMSSSKRARLLKALRAARRSLMRGYEIKPGLLELDARSLRLLSGAWIVEELAEGIKSEGLVPAVVEEYPTWDGLITDLKTF
jgi:pyruvate formate-lyase activating enzyme-like uncharacterized protein